MLPHHLLLASMFRPFQLVPASLEPCLPSQPSPRPPELFLSAGNSVALRKLCELRAGEKCCVVGTLFKAMQLQPSILQEISEEVTAGTFPPVGPPTSSTQLWGYANAHGDLSQLPFASLLLTVAEQVGTARALTRGADV